MPIVHIVLVKVKPGVDSSDYIQTATAFLSGLRSVSSFKVGHATNGPAKNRGFNFAMVLEFRDAAAMAEHGRAMRQAEADGQFVIPGASDLIVNDFVY